MRITKEHDERRNEILDTAEKLFYTKGYMKTTVNDMLQEIGIAKGTFYYYFKSKEEVMHAMIERIVDLDLEVALSIAQDTQLDVHTKLLNIMLSQGQEARPDMHKKELIQQFQHPGNEIMHHQTLAIIIRRLSPILADVVNQGIAEGLFHLNNVQETIEILFAGAEFIFDSGIFQWTDEEKANRAQAFLTLMENALGAKKDSFSYLISIFMK